MNRTHRLLLPAALLWTHAGCAPLPAESVPAPKRALLTLGQALPPQPAAIAAFEARTSRTAGTPVRHVAGVSALVQAVELSCTTSASCDAVLQRLRSDAPYITDARLDGRKRPSGG